MNCKRIRPPHPALQHFRVANIAKQAGFEYRIEENVRSMSLEFLAPDREVPLLLFDAADPGNLCWFTCGRFYVDGRTLPNARRLQVFKELPTSFPLPGKQLLTEQLVYAVLYNLLNALMNTGRRRLRRPHREAPLASPYRKV
jgi:hypothetical protein